MNRRATAVPRLSFAALAFVALIVATGRTANFEPPAWAYLETPRDFQPDAKYVVDLFAPRDLYPAEHPRMPQVPVARGRKPNVPACASCHLPNGVGRPESSSLVGLSAEYMAMELANFKSGARHSSVGVSPMADIARALTVDEATAAVAYYARLPRLRTPWITVVESDMAPRTRIVENGLPVPVEPQELEPLGDRIVEVPKEPAQARLYDAHASFVAYAPKGSIRRGRAYVSSGGGQNVACANCHGATLRGLPHAPDSDVPVPGIVGRSPTYIVRQLYDVHSGARSAASTTLMKPIAAQMTLQQMIDIAAYLASKAP